LTQPRDDSGFSIVECVAAIAVLAIVLVPTIRTVIYAQQATNSERIQGEAAAAATQALENLEAEVQQGTIPFGHSTQVVMAGTDRLTVNLDFTITTAGASSTVCSTASNGALPDMWVAKATVYWGPEVNNGWPRMQGAPPFTETTELAAGVAGALSESAGEIAVPIVNASGAAYTSSPVTVTLSPSSTPSSVPTGDVTSGTETTQTGCAVFLDVDPSSSLTYTVSVNNSANSAGGANGTEIIDTLEHSYDNPAQIAAQTGITAQIGEPTLTSPFTVGVAAPVTVSFATVGKPTVAAASPMPVTVANDPGLGTSAGADDYVFPTFPSGTMYLFPFSATYTAWAGDMPNSNPGASDCASALCYPTAPASATASISASSSAASSVTLPVYDLVLKLSTTMPTGDQLTATDTSSPGTVYRLNAPSGTADATGMPLGEYVVGDTLGDATKIYVWVAYAGVYYSTTGMSTPTSGTLAGSSGVPVTI
jgi:hypothetical protein